MARTWSRWCWHVLGLMVTVALVGALAEQPAEAAVSPKKAAARLAVKAARAEKRKKFDEAAQLYKEAFALRADYKYLFSAAKNCEAAKDVDCALDAYKQVMEQDTTKPARAADARVRYNRLDESLKVPLQIRLSPNETETELDGVVISKAVVQTIKLKPGKHVLVFRNPGYGEERREIEAVRGTELPSLDVVLKKLEGKIVVNADKPGAQLSLNGRYYGTLPLAEPILVPAGDHMIHIELADHESIDKTIRVEAGAIALENLTLRPIPKPEPPKVEEPLPEPAPAVCGHCDPPMPTAGLPFTGPRAVHRLGLEVWASMGWESGASQYSFVFSPIIELAPVPRWFSIGIVPRFFVSMIDMNGSRTMKGMLSGDLGFKITPYDDLHGTAVSILVLGRVTNDRKDEFHFDSVGPGGGVIGSVAVGPVRLMGSAHGVYPIKVSDFGYDRTEIGWSFGPAWDIMDSGHHLFLALGGSIPIVSGSWSHTMDGGIGYAYSTDQFKASFMLTMPLTHRSTRKLEDLGMTTQALWQP